MTATAWTAKQSVALDSHFMSSGIENESTGWLAISGIAEVAMYGTWGSGTYKVQMTRDGGTTAIDIPGASLTANGAFLIELGRDCKIRITGSGGSGNSITATIAPQVLIR